MAAAATVAGAARSHRLRPPSVHLLQQLLLQRCRFVEGNWYELVAAQKRHIAAVKTPAARVELYLESAQIQQGELDDPHPAINSLMNVLAIDDANKSALGALPRLYLRTEAFDRAVDTLVKHAALEGDKGAHLYAEAGRIAFENLMDPELAQRHLEKGLSLDNENLAALKALGRLHEKRGNWTQAVELLLRAEAASGSRNERIALLWHAGTIADRELEDPSRRR